MDIIDKIKHNALQNLSFNEYKDMHEIVDKSITMLSREDRENMDATKMLDLYSILYSWFKKYKLADISTFNKRLRLNENGFEMLGAGGWLQHKENTRVVETLEKEQNKYNLLMSKHVYRYRWLPYILSIASFLLSLVALML